ncbi:hypothetical protein CFTD6683_08860, partial [Campylobacter fetus subsp. testudinum]|uniref:DUF4214 domain-containing protein n=1 Tax=Campylobacter fetus TaxID=196 RepID=UPI0008287217
FSLPAKRESPKSLAAPGVSSLANIMLDSPGAAKFFGDSLLAGNEKEFVTKIYSIALGSTSDVDGINYWTKAITGGGEFTIVRVMLLMLLV